MTPDFETVYTPDDANLLRDTYDAITECDLWGWMKEYTPHQNEGYMFNSHPNLVVIQKAMKYADYHSGASWGWTMRTMESIAKLGWDYVRRETRERRALQQLKLWAAEVRAPKGGYPCHCRTTKGYSYGWCGVAGGGVPACDH